MNRRRAQTGRRARQARRVASDLARSCPSRRPRRSETRLPPAAPRELGVGRTRHSRRRADPLGDGADPRARHCRAELAREVGVAVDAARTGRAARSRGRAPYRNRLSILHPPHVPAQVLAQLPHPTDSTCASGRSNGGSTRRRPVRQRKRAEPSSRPWCNSDVVRAAVLARQLLFAVANAPRVNGYYLPRLVPLTVLPIVRRYGVPTRLSLR